MPSKALKEYLDHHKVKYISTTHSPAFTSQEVAASAHVSSWNLAKVVVVKLGDQFALVVLPAQRQVNFSKLKEATGIMAELAAESEFKDKFPQCEVGTMPPFGHLYQMPVFVCSELSQQDNIIFNAGSHSELMQLAYQDFARMEKPKVIAL